MSNKPIRAWCIAASGLICATALQAQAAPATALTYQGQLKEGGIPANGNYDFVFRLFDAESGPAQVGSDQPVGDWLVSNGLFTVRLDFGSGVFPGDARWLEVAVRPAGTGDSYTVLSPRQAVTAAPYAVMAANTFGVDGHSLDAADGSPTDRVYVNNDGNVGIGTVNPSYSLHVVGDGTRAVYIKNDAANGSALEARSANRTAVRAYGGTYGVDAYTASPTGYAVYGFNEAESGNAYAVYGENISPDGIAIYGHTSHSADYSGGIGIYGFADNDGMYTTGIGVYGRSESDKPGIGVYGETTNTGTTYGVSGVSAHGTGVRGEQGASGNHGSLGTSTAGVYGRTTQKDHYAVRGYANENGFASYFTGGRNYFEGNVGIGTNEPEDRLHVSDGDLRLDGNIKFYKNDVLAAEMRTLSLGKYFNFVNTNTGGTVAQIGTSGSDGAGFFTLRNRAGSTTTIELDGDSDGVQDDDTSGSIRIRSTGGGPGGELDIANDDGFTTIRALGGNTSDGGTLELFNEAGTGTIFLDGDNSNYGAIRLRDADGNTGILLRADRASSVAGEVSLYNDDGFETVELLAAEGSSNGGEINLRKADGTRTVEIDAEFGPDGGAHVGLLGGDDGPTLYVEGSGAGRNDATLRVHNTEPNQGMAAYISSDSTWATMHVKNDGLGETLWLESNGGGHLIVARDPDRWQFWVDGDGITNSRVLRIHGGADLSEGFDVRGLQGNLSDQADPSTRLTPEPGMVVSIDPENPGKLTISSEGYDRTVAGIISGAGGVKSGMLMGQSDSGADGDYPVALTGRVYCLCVASNGSIKPGDLLTTSDVPGHAMKVTDHSRAAGAVLGKAMTRLAQGEAGLVLVLVSLQ